MRHQDWLATIIISRVIQSISPINQNQIKCTEQRGGAVNDSYHCSIHTETQ